MTSSPLFLRARATIRIEAEVDAVAYFAALGSNAKSMYFGMNISEWGCEEEYERPMAFLMSDISDRSGGTGLHAIGMKEDTFSGEVDWDGGPSVSQRSGQRIWGAESYWSLTDYEVLLAAVPWMRPEAEVENSVHPDQGMLDL